MRPVRTNGSNFVYLGPTPDIGDAWVRRAMPNQRAVYLAWKPSAAERAAIAAGALIELGIYNLEPIPPVSLNISHEAELSPAGAALRDRARNALKAIAPSPGAVPPGHWYASPDVWEALQAEHALDPGDGVPTLEGRPLMTGEGDGQADQLEYITPATHR